MKNILFAFLLVIFLTGQGSACGVLVSEDGTNVRADHLLAAIHWDEQKQQEDLIIKVHYLVNEGEVDRFGWIMPFPAQPQMELANQGFFMNLYRLTIQKENWLEKAKLPQLPMMGGLKGVDGAAPSGVDVIGQKDLGVYQTVTVKARDTASLQKWAKENHFSIPWMESEVIQNYIDLGWVFVLMNLDPSKSIEEGDIQPIRFSFSTDEAIYPLQLAALNRQGESRSTKTIPITLFLLSKEKIAPKEPFLEAMTQEYGGWLSEQEIESLYLDESHSLWVSRWDAVLQADQIEQDLILNLHPALPQVGSGKMSGWEPVQLFWTLLSGGIRFLLTMGEILLTLFVEDEQWGQVILYGFLIVITVGLLKKYSLLQFFKMLGAIHAIGAILLIFHYKDEPLLILSQFVMVALIGMYFLITWYKKTA